MHQYSLETTLELIKSDIPNLQEKDLLTLTNLIQEHYESSSKQELNAEGTAIHPNWVPTPSAVKEALSIGVRLVDLDRCIQSFVDFAKKKTYTENLSSKFITHIKIMIQQGKLSLMEGK